MIGLTLMVSALAACNKTTVENAAAPAAAPAPTNTATAEATPPPAAPAPIPGQISMLDHLKSVNKTMCMVMVKENPTKTQADCETEMNKMSELNPQNATLMISKAQSDACLDGLRGATSDQLLTMSTEGACSLAALQTP